MVASSYLFLLQNITFILLAWIVICDVSRRKVPNFSLVILLVTVVLATPFNWLYASLGLVVLLVGIFAFHFRWLGAGDSKLLAICIYASQEQWHWLLFQMALIGGGLGLLCLIYNRAATHNLIQGAPVKTVPYAVAICGAAFSTIHYM